MKKLSLTSIILAVAVSSFATGLISKDGPLAGVDTFTSASGLIITNTFAVPFSHPPFVTTYSTSTNSTPFTVSSVTTTGFVLTVTSDSTTNNAVTWSAVAGYPRIQAGTVSLTGGTPSTNSFPVAFGYSPSVTVGGSTTNGISVTVSASSIILKSDVTQTAYYSALGVTINPGASTVTY